jgi:hypothetical protein
LPSLVGAGSFSIGSVSEPSVTSGPDEQGNPKGSIVPFLNQLKKGTASERPLERNERLAAAADAAPAIRDRRYSLS